MIVTPKMIELARKKTAHAHGVGAGRLEWPEHESDPVVTQDGDGAVIAFGSARVRYSDVGGATSYTLISDGRKGRPPNPEEG